jgi:hypothetical protein
MNDLSNKHENNVDSTTCDFQMEEMLQDTQLHPSTQVQCEGNEKRQDNNADDSIDVFMNDLSNEGGNIVDSITCNLQVEEMLQDIELHPSTKEQLKQNIPTKVETNEQTINNNEHQFEKDDPTSVKCSNDDISTDLKLEVQCEDNELRNDNVDSTACDLQMEEMLQDIELHPSIEIQCEDDEKRKHNNATDSTDVLMNDLSNKHRNIVDSTTCNVQVEQNDTRHRTTCINDRTM